MIIGTERRHLQGEDREQGVEAVNQRNQGVTHKYYQQGLCTPSM